jgi:predicted TIM-barrel fold metal-dependent hydrolase
MLGKENFMIIDAHMHLSGTGWVRGKYLRFVWKMYITEYNRVHKTNKTPDDFKDMLTAMKPSVVDPEGDGIVELMDKAGVDKAVIFPVDWEAITGPPKVPYRDQNKAHADAAKKHKGRFIPICALDPRRGNAMDLAKEAIEDWGMKGFYFMPATGFKPDDPVCFPIYEKCLEWKVPMIIHCGKEIAHWDYNHPTQRIANVALMYPELKVVLGHAGTRIYRNEAIEACIIPNLYMDFSEYQGFWRLQPDYFYQWLRDAIDACGPEKVMFGSGFPNPNVLTPEAEWVKAIMEPKTNIEFTAEEIEMVMGKSAEAVFDTK